MELSSGVDSRGGGGHLVERLRAAGLRGPVLVVADEDATSRWAPAWAAAFAASGWTHRVFAAGPAEFGAIVAEAESLRAATMAAVGDAAMVAAVESAAAMCGLPWIALPCAEGDVDPATL